MPETPEDIEQILADLRHLSAVQRRIAMTSAYADYVLFAGERAAELEAAGHHQEAVELRRRVAEMMPPDTPLPPLPPLPAKPPNHNVPAVNGAVSPPLLPQPRRGRPPKHQGGPTS